MIRRIKIVDRPEEVLYIKFWAIVLAIYVISSAIGLFHGYLWS